MSGIVGIVNADGAPVDRDLLTGMAEFLRFRGPDSRRVWTDGHVGLGHTLLATTDDAVGEQQPCTLDGHVWITADARIDARADLIRNLEARGRTGLAALRDSDLLLHAYGAWGERCVDYLLGDFAFAIWDGPNRRLFCARDHYGVKSFFYARCRGTFVFSNTLDCIRKHPAVSDAINDLAIADFLLFERNQEPDTTAFEDIRRLPPAHTLTWEVASGDPVIRRFWSPPAEAEIHYRRASDYVERFQELLREAVKDRLRSKRVAIAMSGGLDSSLVAAVAKKVLADGGQPFDLQAHTVVYDHLMPDEERKYAGLVAQALRIPINFFVADGYGPFDRCEEAHGALPEPASLAFRALATDFYAQVAGHARVLLSGTDADALLGEFASEHIAALAGTGQFGRWAATVARHAMWFHRRPPLGLRAWKQRKQAQAGTTTRPLPDWLNPDLVARLCLRERWQHVRHARIERQDMRPRATACMEGWSQVFEAGDASVLRAPIEYRYPFADVRLVGYLLAIPVVPWCTDKTLIRRALKGVLPDAIRHRKKTPVARDQVQAALGRDGVVGIDRLTPADSLARYVTHSVVPPDVGRTADGNTHVALRPWNLNHWLRYGIENGPAKTRHLAGAEDGKRRTFESNN